MFNDYDLSTQLDFIALESAVMEFEAVNYLDKYEPEEQIHEAAESTTSDSEFAFGADLFVETVATESVYPTEPALEGVGQKIWATIKSIFNAIANFFKSLFKRTDKVAQEIRANSSHTPSSSQPQSSTRKKVILDENGKEISEEESKRRIAEKQMKAQADNAEYERKKASAAEYEKYKQAQATKEKENEDRRKKYDEEMQRLHAKSVAERKEAEDKLAKADKERERIKSLRHIEYEINSYVTSCSFAYDKYFEVLKEACSFIGETEIPKIMRKISKSIEDLRNKHIDISTKEGMNEASREYRSKFEYSERLEYVKRGGGHMDDTQKDLAEIGAFIDQVRNRVGNLEKVRKVYIDKTQTIIKISEQEANEFISKDEIQQKAHFELSKRAQSRVGKDLLQTLQNICKVCKENTDFCSKAAQHNYKELNEGQALFFLCKNYLEMTKYYNKVCAYIIAKP